MFSVAINENGVEILGFNVESEPAVVAMKAFVVEPFVNSPTSIPFISTSNREIATPDRDGVELWACIATQKRFDVAAYEAGVEEWEMDVEDAWSDVAEISGGAAPGSLAADG